MRFSANLKAAARAAQGEKIILETFDCFEGQVRKSEDMLAELDWEHVNPASGPVYIEGVQPGDVICLNIQEVKTAAQSIVVAMSEEGALGDIIQETEALILPHRDGKVIFKDKLAIEAKPMIGVIGLAPAQGSIPNGTPDRHGGNMDCTTIGANTRLYLTAEVEGGLIGCGDLHSVMGDGEIIVTGAETDGEVHLTARTVNLKGLPTPFLETKDQVATIFSAENLEEATSGAIHRMAHFLTEIANIPLNDAGMLMSLVGSLRFCQVVDPNKTIRFEFPKSALLAYGFEMPS